MNEIEFAILSQSAERTTGCLAHTSLKLCMDCRRFGNSVGLAESGAGRIGSREAPRERDPKPDAFGMTIKQCQVLARMCVSESSWLSVHSAERERERERCTREGES